MKGMPLPFEFEGKGVLELGGVPSDSLLNKWNKEGCCIVGRCEPTSVLDTRRSPSPPTSTSTLSSSLGGGGGGGSTDTSGVAAVSGTLSQKWPPAQQQQQQQDSTSSNLGVESGGSTGGVGRKEEWGLELQPIPTALEMGSTGTAATEKCGLGLEDWESVLSETAASPSQEQSILGWIMGDVEDPGMGLNKLLQTGGPPDFEFSGGFGLLDQGFGFDPSVGVGVGMGLASSSSIMGGTITPSVSLNPCSGGLSGNNKFNITNNNYKTHHSNNPPNGPNPIFGPLSNPISLSPVTFNQHQQPQHQRFEVSDEKPQIFNPQLVIKQQNHQPPQHTQNPPFFMPLPYTQQEQQQQQQPHHLLLPPHPKRHHSAPLDCPIPNSGQELFVRRQQQQNQQQQPQGFGHQLQLLPHHVQQRPAMTMKPKMVGPAGSGSGDEMAQQQQQQIIDQLFKAAELVETGNPVLAQGILARLNHQLSSIGKPFQRAAYYFKEALQLLLHNINTASTGCSPHSSSPISLFFKIGAYKSFSEISPLLQFANFTCNQALLEALEGFDRIHILDFDIGYGGQWASLMQELALRNGGALSLKITAFASPSTHDQLELGLTRENLNHFASEINIAFEFEIVSLDSLNSASWSLPFHVSDSEAIAVNLPVGSSSNYQLSLPLVLHFVKQLSPKIVVSVDRGCDRTDLPFSQHILHALQSYSTLLESLDAVNVNLDALQKIERFLVQPSIEKIVLGRHRSPEKTQPWRTLFLSSGFSPLTFSNFTESQAECVVKRTPVRGFHVDKRQSSLVLCWQRKELISASAWRC